MKKQNKTIVYDVSGPALLDAALRYLARYAASCEQVRRVLARRFLRAGLPEDRPAIAAVLTQLEKQGLLDDAGLAARQAARLRAAGRSARHIEQTLAGKGIARAARAAALENSDAELGMESGDETAEIAAARIYVRKKKLGPHRPSLRKREDAASAETAREAQQKDLARLARAGFSQTIARKVLGES